MGIPNSIPFFIHKKGFENMPGWQEWLGYIASLIVLVSLLMSSVKRLRWINMTGSLVFAVYGFLISAYPVAVMNLGIVMINSYYLYQMYSKKDYFKLLHVSDLTYFNAFVSSYEKDMKEFMSFEEPLDDPSLERLFILRNTVPAGILVGKKKEDAFEILVDYVTPMYRDFKIGSFLYEDQKNVFKEKGISKLITKPGNKRHEAYLKRMGFIKNDQSSYIKAL
jgi:hypothetical protein